MIEDHSSKARHMFRWVAIVVLSIAAYLVSATLIFGDAFAPILFLGLPSDRLAAPTWRVFLPAAAIIAAIIAGALFKRWGWSAYISIPLFIALSMSLFVVSVGAYTEWLRRPKVQEFKADEYIERSFFQSIRQAPREFQFFLHGAALKNCVPYAWSYRNMGFYEIPARAAVNVLPDEWLSRCAIKRPE